MPAHLADHLRVQRLARRDRLAEHAGSQGQVGLDEHPPHRRRCAEGRDALGADGLQHPLGVEALVVVDEDRRLGDPRCEEAAPGVLRPPRRADREVHVTGPQAEPVHRGEVTDRVRRVGVLDELRPARGSRGEVVQQRLVHPGAGVILRCRRRQERVLVGGPVRRAGSDPDAGDRGADAVELVRVGAGGDDIPDRSAHDAVIEVGAADRDGRREDDRPDLDQREHRLPELDLVAEHEHHRIAPRDPERLQPCGELVRAGRHLVERADRSAAVLFDDDERRGGVAAGDDIEPLDRPVEGAVDLGPAELRQGARVVLAERDELIAGVAQAGGRGAGHGASSSSRRDGTILPDQRPRYRSAGGWRARRCRAGARRR